MNNTDFLFGYKYALNGNFWGPSLIGSIGYLSNSTKMTDTSPVAFSSFETTGLQMQVGGYFPVSEANDVGVGLDAKFLLKTNLSGATLTNTILTGADLTQSNFTGLNLTNRNYVSIKSN